MGFCPIPRWENIQRAPKESFDGSAREAGKGSNE